MVAMLYVYCFMCAPAPSFLLLEMLLVLCKAMWLDCLVSNFSLLSLPVLVSSIHDPCVEQLTVATRCA